MRPSNLIHRHSLWLLTIIFFCLSCPAFADYPLQVEYIADLPRDAVCIDVQYWMNDSIPGWAAMSHDTVYFTTEIGAPVRATHVHDQTAWDIRILRLEQFPDVPVITMHQVGNMDAYSRQVNLETGETILNAFLYMHYYSGMFEDFYTDLTDWQIYPPLPAPSRYIVYNTATSTAWDAFGRHGTRDYSYVTIHNANNQSEVGSSEYGTSFSFFSEDDSSLMISHYGTDESETYDWDEGYEEGSWTRAAGLIVNNAEASRCTLCVAGRPCLDGRIASQTDADGTRRVISAQNIAFDPYTWQVLWTGPTTWPNDGVYAVRTYGSADERIFFWYANQHRFAIHSAQDGSFICWTSALQGSPHILKRRNAPDEIVMHTPQTGSTPQQLLFYTVSAPPVEGLTIYNNSPNGNIARLRWHSYLTPVAFRIMGSCTFSRDYFEVATVPGTQLFYDVPTMENTPFFYQVIAVYDSAR
ncbi:hypothetical protein EHM69_08140 [candidate division KSB1 bacterium]|nr:MAG: hypothetical protein EHM69_08140 [candidate division KSB1 bacterium]